MTNDTSESVVVVVSSRDTESVSRFRSSPRFASTDAERREWYVRAFGASATARRVAAKTTALANAFAFFNPPNPPKTPGSNASARAKSSTRKPNGWCRRKRASPPRNRLSRVSEDVSSFRALSPAREKVSFDETRRDAPEAAAGELAAGPLVRERSPGSGSEISESSALASARTASTVSATSASGSSSSSGKKRRLKKSASASASASASVVGGSAAAVRARPASFDLRAPNREARRRRRFTTSHSKRRTACASTCAPNARTEKKTNGSSSSSDFFSSYAPRLG